MSGHKKKKNTKKQKKTEILLKWNPPLFFFPLLSTLSLTFPSGGGGRDDRGQNFHVGNMPFFLSLFSCSFFKKWVLCLLVCQNNNVYLKCVNSSNMRSGVRGWWSLSFPGKAAKAVGQFVCLIHLQFCWNLYPRNRLSGGSGFYPKGWVSFRFHFFPSVVWAEFEFQRNPVASRHLMWCGLRQPGIEPTFSWTLVGFISTESQWELLTFLIDLWWYVSLHVFCKPCLPCFDGRSFMSYFFLLSFFPKLC